MTINCCPTCGRAYESQQTTPLTPRQRDVVLFISTYEKEHHIGPSFRDMAAALGLASRSSIHGLVEKLEQRGWVRRQPGRARALGLTPAGLEAVKGWSGGGDER